MIWQCVWVYVVRRTYMVGAQATVFFLFLKDIIPNLPNELRSRVWFKRLTGALLVPAWRRVCVCVCLF
jgi:hypothetical protein